MIKIIIVTMLLVVAGCYGALAVIAGDNGLTEILLIKEIKPLARYLVTVLGALAVLRYWDLLLGLDFKVWLREAPDNVKGNYFSFRVLSICILFGLLANASL